jgi:dipeptidyl aminopeptidase/acylaminoacyl peptidase
MRAGSSMIRTSGTSLVLLAILAAGATFAHDGDVVSRRAYRFPEWDSLRSAERYVDRDDYERARRDARFRMERIEYRSGALTVSAYVYAPAARPARRRPCVIYVRGSWTVRDIGWQLAPTFRRLAEGGFVVIAPLLRGSDGSAGKDEMGGADLEDLLGAARVAATSDVADSSRLFLYGESRGGMMVLQALRDGFLARAAATIGAFTDLDSMILADTTALEPVARAIWPDWPTRRAEIAERRSAQRWASRLRAPVLLMHGAADPQVAPAHALRLAAAVRAAGGRAATMIFPGAGHTLRGHESARDSAAIAWFLHGEELAPH